jgi:hypothetical protein
MWSYISEHSAELISQVLATLVASFIGFLSAQLFSSALEARRAREVFRSLLDCVRAEASANTTVLEESFEQLSKEGVVLAKLDTSVSRQQLGSPEFIKHSTPEQLATIGSYLRLLELSNAYADNVQLLDLHSAAPNSTERDKSIARIEAVWQPNIKECKRAIAEVMRL